jgi:hypothetical protein
MMTAYTLSINIHSESQELLENLMITLETIKGDVSDLESIEVLTVSGPVCIDGHLMSGDRSLTVTQRNLFLDKWAVNDG